MSIDALDVAALNQRMKGKVYDQIVLACVWLKWLRAWGAIKFRQGGAQGIDFWVQYRETARGIRAITPYTNLQAKTTSDFKKLTSPWAVYGDAIATSKYLEKRAQNTPEADINFDWLVNQMAAFLKTFRKGLAQELYSGDGTPNASREDLADTMLGLDVWIDDNNTILGENRGTTGAYFAANRVDCADPTGDDDTTGDFNLFSDLEQLYNECSIGGKHSQGAKVADTVKQERAEPDLLLSGQGVHELYNKLLRGRMRIMSKGADGLYETNTCKGKPYDWDSFCLTSRAFWVNKDTWMLHTVEDDDQLCSIYAEDESGVVKGVQYGSQITQKCTEPRKNGVSDVTLS